MVLDCCRRNKIKSSQISQFLIKMFFFTEICWERHQISASTTKNKQAKAIFQSFLLIKLPWLTSMQKTPPNCKVGLGEMFLVVCNLHETSEADYIASVVVENILWHQHDRYSFRLQRFYRGNYLRMTERSKGKKAPPQNFRRNYKYNHCKNKRKVKGKNTFYSEMFISLSSDS